MTRDDAAMTGHEQDDAPLLEFLGVMRRLRAECPWKQQQTHRSLARYLLEETHETLEAIDTGDTEHLREELGDLLLQVYFHAVVAEESGAFTIDDVARDITAKMVRRNPHVFGDAADGADAGSGSGDLGAAEVNEAWEAIKAQEKSRASVTDGLPPTLPALLLADKVLDRLERAGGSQVRRLGPNRDGGTEIPAVWDQSAADVDPATRIGDRLLAVVAEARADGVDTEQALRDAVRRLLPDREQ